MISAFRSSWSAKTKDSNGQSLRSGDSARNLGLRILNQHDRESIVDIVFVHGLTGSENTWGGNDAPELWPEVFFKEDIPTARVMMYSYDADVVNFWSMASQSKIGDHATKLITSLANLRDGSEAENRPIIFVAHSLGGIVCQDALLKSRGSADDHLRQILECTRGICFLGTPHCGAGLADWAVRASKFVQLFRTVNTETLQVLQQRSEVLARIKGDFHTMLRAREQEHKPDVKIVCFFEELPVRNVGVIVPRESAILDRYPAIGIRKNHMDMTKFSTRDSQDYQNVLAELQRWIRALNISSTRQAPLRNPELPMGRADLPRNTKQDDGQDSLQSKGNMQEEREEDVNRQPSDNERWQQINQFSGTFKTSGGKAFYGGSFNSGGGPMSF